MRKSVVLLACFLVVTVGVLGTLFFAVWVPPSDSAKTPAPELKTTKTNPPVHKKAAPICPNNGVSAPQATGTCSSPVATLSLNGTLCSPNYTASVQCDHLNGWSLQEAAFPTDVVEQVLSNANMFGITVSKTSLGYSFSIKYQVCLINSGTANAVLSSFLAILEQTGVSVTYPSYGPSGSNQQGWSVSGTENALTAGKCNSPGKAQICDGKSCNVTVPYHSNTTLLTQSQLPLDLSSIVVPAGSTCSRGGVNLNLTTVFVVSDANYTLMTKNLNNYRLSLLVSYDTNCAKGSNCGIDIDCNGVVNGITTTQSRLSLFKLPLCNSSTERCNYVALSTSNLSISSNLTNSACNSSATVNSGGSIITSSVSLLVRGTETCSTLDSLCAGSYSFNTSIVFAQSLSPGPGVNCTSPLGISLISPSSAQARHDFLCRYPLPVDCVVSDWSEWSVVTPCGVPTCEIVSTRNRTIQTNSSHGGLSCPPLADSKSVDCTSNDCDYPDTVCTAATPCSMETCSTSMDCTRTSIVPSTCTNGAVTSCEPVTTTQTTPCTKCFYTEWASWTNVGACEGGLQTQNRIRELVKACPSTNTCTDVLETQEIPCVQPRDCTFGINPNCENSINCGFGIYCCGSCQTPPSPSPSPSPSPCCIPDPDPDCPHLNLCSTGPCCGRCRC